MAASSTFFRSELKDCLTLHQNRWYRAMAGRTWLIGTILSFLKPSVSGDCFPDAVPAEQRSLLVSESETFPLGIQTVGNAHGNATCNLRKRWRQGQRDS